MDSFVVQYRDFFQKRIQELESAKDGQTPGEIEESPRETPETSVCVRIRPLTEYEQDQNQIAGALKNLSDVVNIYEPRKKINGKPDLNSSSFTLDEVYGPDKSNENIYSTRVHDLIEWALGGGTSMLLAYGQTGSGKTYTISGLESLLVNRMIQEQSLGLREVRVCIFEISGSNIFDLLNARVTLTAREDVFGTMQLGGVSERSPNTSTEFLELINTAKTLRSTESTAKNDQSSRSHSICRIRIVDIASDTAEEGTIMLVDLAGSEANSDTSQHSKERMAETREINKSLNVLKECITKRAQWSRSKTGGNQKHIHIPFRTNKLTQVLKSAFDVNNTQTCKTIVIACIAPSILDVAQSKNTLRYAETLRVPIPKAKPMPFHEYIPTTWTNEDVQDWIKKNSGKPTINPHLLAPKETGTQTCRLNEDEFVRRALLTENVKPEQAKLLYFKLWGLHIDSRALLNRQLGSIENLDTSELKSKATNGKRKNIVKPGMFFRVKAGDTKENFDVVMAMGSEESGEWSCAAVCMASEIVGGYELFVAKQAVVKAAALAEEIVLVYDQKSRYYYVKDE